MEFIGNLYTYISDETGYVRHLPKNVDALVVEAGKLDARCKDIKSEEQQASRKRKRLTEEAQNWLDRAQKIQEEIGSIELEFNQRRTDGWLSGVPASYKLGKRAFEVLQGIPEFLKEGRDLQLLAMASPPRALEMDMPTSLLSDGQKKTMEKIWNFLFDEHTCVICVYGMGGIGKTTLMKAINDKLLHIREFDFVIWVTVSKGRNLESLQKDIMRRLDLQFDQDDSLNNRSMQLREYLTNKRHMLILDDLWDSINLCEVGIPSNKESRSKIVITTRDEQLFTDIDMKAEKIKVEALTADEAWDLFATNVGENVVNQPDIKDIAEDVAEECGGLPLAIMVAAKAMKGKREKELWEDALRALKASAPEIPGMKRQVFQSLKMSYDHLGDEEANALGDEKVNAKAVEQVKMCFLHCSLFPEDYEFGKERLARLWMMEGFIDNVDNLYDGSNKGHRIIEMLRSGCLLEEGYQSKDRVKMHDVIRDLALYIASSSCEEGPKFLVKAGSGKTLPPVETWGEFEKISFMGNGIKKLPRKPECPNLVSLFLRWNPITDVPQSFFELMPALRVLDLSACSITSLSVSSSSLLNLRALDLSFCKQLTHVPFLGQLKELQFLDISDSGIRSLPKAMQNLVKLKRLNMTYLTKLRTIPSNVISGLSSLEELCMRGTDVEWAKGSELTVENNVRLGEMAKLKRLTKMEIIIKDFDCLGKDVFDLHQLSKLKKFSIIVGRLDAPGFKNCKKNVVIVGGDKYPSGLDVIMSLTEGLRLGCASYVKDVSQFVRNANNLRILKLDNCVETECILDWSDVGENALQNIEQIELWSLRKLQNLFKGKVPQRCLRKLKRIRVARCEELKSLFSFEMVQNLNQLETLEVRGCTELKEIIEGDKSLPEIPFPQLCKLELCGLDKLESIIHQDTLALPSLIELDILDCPVLRLPERPNTTDWPRITSGKASWKAS